MNSNSLVQQVIYPLKDIYPDSGSLSHLLTINMQACILDIKQTHTRKHIACLSYVCLDAATLFGAFGSLS